MAVHSERERIRSLFTTALVACLIFGPSLLQGQQSKDKWHRVYTGEGYVIEINASSLRFQPDHVLRVQFRTILSNPETLGGSSGEKYKTRLEAIEFKLDQGRYRISDTTVLDSSGKELQWYTTDKMREWRVLKSGGVTERLFAAARAMPPFGTWKVIAYRSADGELNQPVSKELENLIGARVNLQFNRAEVGSESCAQPAFEDTPSPSAALFRDMATVLKSVGVQSGSTDMVTINCKDGGWQPPMSLLVKLREGEMLMLWDGVFLVLKRDR